VRNDRIVALLNAWWNNGAGDPDAMGGVRDELDAAINQLDQSALRDGEYVKKVLGNLGHPVPGHLGDKIATLVTSYRRKAVEEASLKVYRPLAFTRSWTSSMTQKYSKLGL
jgi:hypothetical protein